VRLEAIDVAALLREQHLDAIRPQVALRPAQLRWYLDHAERILDRSVRNRVCDVRIADLRRARDRYARIEGDAGACVAGGNEVAGGLIDRDERRAHRRLALPERCVARIDRL